MISNIEKYQRDKNKRKRNEDGQGTVLREISTY